MLLRSSRALVLMFAVAALCLLVRQNARMQTTLRRITHTPEAAKNLNPGLSGDGRILAFESTEDLALGGGKGFHSVRADTASDPTTFAQIAATRAASPALSEDGSKIAFAAGEDPLGMNPDFNSEIFLYDGDHLLQVTATAPRDSALRASDGNFQPSISDDGRFIAFASNRQLTGGNADGNFEIFVYDALLHSFVQITDSAGVVGATNAKISGDGRTIAYIFDSGADRSLLRTDRPSQTTRVLAAGVPTLAVTFGRAISDDGQRIVWSAETAPDTSQVFLFDGRNNLTRQITELGARSSDVPLHPTISGDGSRIAFATRRPLLPGNSDNSIELYTFHIPSGQFGRVTNAPAAADGFGGSRREVEIVSSLSDSGALVAFNFPRTLSGLVADGDMANNSEIYLAQTAMPLLKELTVLNGASLGREPSTTEAVSPDSVAVAQGTSLSFRAEQSSPVGEQFSQNVAGTTVKVNGISAELFYVSPTQVNFHVPAAIQPGIAEVVVTNSDGFQSHGTVLVLNGAPGMFSATEDGSGDGVILNADTHASGPFDPTDSNLRLIVFSTGIRRATISAVMAGGRALKLESVGLNPNLPGLDELHVLVPPDLRGAGRVELLVRADGRDSNSVVVEFSGDARRDVLINEFLADPADGPAGDANHDGVRDSSDDEFVELVNTTSHDIDLGGYRVLTRGNSGTSDVTRHEFALGTIVPACTSLVVFGGGSPDSLNSVFSGAQVYKAKSGSLSLTNSGGVITLADRLGTVMSSVSYGGSTGIIGDANQSLTRSPDLTGTFKLHQSAGGSSGKVFSPGTRLDGTAFLMCSPISRIELSPTVAAVDVGEQRQYVARAFDALENELSGVIFSWSSSDPSVATIDQRGLVTALAPGTTEIRVSGRGVFSSPATLTVKAVVPPNVFINEVDSDQAGSDTSEFVELYDGGVGNTSLAGLVVVFFNGTDDRSYAAFDLDSFRTDANGYFVMGNTAAPGVDFTFADGLMQNGADAVAVYLGNATDFPNGTPIKTTNLIDAIVYDTNDADDTELLGLLNSGEPQVDEDTGDNGATRSNQRCPNGSGGARNTATYRQFAPTPDSPNICAEPALPPALSISDVWTAEGNAGETAFTFVVSLSKPAPVGGVTFNIATADSSATVADHDYQARTLLRQTIPAGNQTFDFTVTVFGDTLVEANEVFFVDLTDVVGATVVKARGLGEIQNDDDPLLKISQVYAGGGNAGAQYTHDFVELFNRGNTRIDFANTPYALQYAGATANFGASKVELTSGTILPGQYFLVRLSSGGANGAPLPTPNFTGTIAMAATAGKVALVNGTNSLAGSGCPTQSMQSTIIDFVGYGTTTECFEGAGRAPAPSNTTANLRRSGGCSDTNDNAADFFVTTPFPRNSTTPLNQCAAGVPPNLTINDVSATEGDSGTNAATFTVSLSTPAPATDITFDIGTQDGSATVANNDYAPKSLASERIPAGQQTYTFTVNVNGDTAIESTETFLVKVTNVSGAIPADTQAVGTIQNDDLPALIVNDVTAVEGNAGTKQVTFSVSLSAPAPADVSFDLATADGTAQDGNALGEDYDYQRRALTNQIIPAGSQTYAFAVTVNGDLVVEPDEAFLVNVTNVSGAVVTDSQGVGTIQNDDTPALTVEDATVNETNSGTTTLIFNVRSTLPAPASGITFDIATADGTAQDHNPATDDNDYLARSLTGQTIAPGNTTYSFAVTVNGDTVVEGNETFFVNIANIVNATVADASGQGTIQNDDFPQLVISQVYGGGNNSGATFQNDFVELFNRGTSTVSFGVTPYSVQYASAGGSFTAGNKIDLTSGMLLPGQYFLIKLAGGTTNGVALPTADATGTVNMSASDGKVALVTSTTLLSTTGCPIDTSRVADLIGYGSANCAEGAATPALSATKSARRSNSCSDANLNSADFTVVTNPSQPRNTSSVPSPCP